jgi:polysaccharide biosynthesis protein PslG
VPTPSLAPISTPTQTSTPTPTYPRYNGTPLNRENFGVQIHIHAESIPSLIKHLNTLGVGWVKVQVSWKLYQFEREQYAWDRFEELDELISTANLFGIKVLLSVGKAPEWSRTITELDGPPLDYTEYRKFMTFLAGRYRGQVSAYELWNEPNLQREWNGSPLNASDFVALIQAGAEGVRAIDFDALLISGAPATTGINDGIVAIDDRVYLRSMLEAGLAEFVDAIGVHPYGWANPPDSSYLDLQSIVPSHNDHPSFFFKDTLLDYKIILSEVGVNKSLWVTEFGWGSFENMLGENGHVSSPPADAEFMLNVSEMQQAEYIIRAYELAEEWDIKAPMILWNLNFGATFGTAYSFSGYGILRTTGEPRPSYYTLADAFGDN